MENLMLGLQVAAIGIIGVFVVLAFLMSVIMLVGKVMEEISKKQQAAKTAAPAKASAPAPVASVQAEDDSEIVAVISAAIMAILSSENNGMVPTFEIKKIKQIKRN